MSGWMESAREYWIYFRDSHMDLVVDFDWATPTHSIWSKPGVSDISIHISFVCSQLLQNKTYREPHKKIKFQMFFLFLS